MIGSSRLSFTKVLVDDLDAEAEFYETVLGLKATHRLKVTIDESEIDEVVLESEGGRLILVKYLDRTAPPSGEVVVGFRCTALPALFARAEAAGAKIIRPPRAVEEAGGLLVGVFEDPEGHACEIVEED